MKDFIILTALIVILMFFPLQYVVNQKNHNHMEATNDIVLKAAQKARTDGYFTADNIQWMVNEISSKLAIDPSEIIVDVTTTPKYRMNDFDDREMIAYDVRIPIRRLIALNQVFAIPDSENQMVYPVTGEVASEVPFP